MTDDVYKLVERNGNSCKYKNRSSKLESSRVSARQEMKSRN